MLPESWDEFWRPPWEQGHSRASAWPVKGTGAGKGQEESPRKMFSCSSLRILGRGKMGWRQPEMGETLGISKENTLPLTTPDLWTLGSGKTGWGELGAERSLGNFQGKCSLAHPEGSQEEGAWHVGTRDWEEPWEFSGNPGEAIPVLTLLQDLPGVKAAGWRDGGDPVLFGMDRECGRRRLPWRGRGGPRGRWGHCWGHGGGAACRGRGQQLLGGPAWSCCRQRPYGNRESGNTGLGKGTASQGTWFSIPAKNPNNLVRNEVNSPKT